MMLVGYPPDRSIVHTCTAVLVAPTVLLTSAHCIDEPPHPDYLYGVFTGDDASAYPLLVDLEPQLKAVTAIYPHPEYSPTLPFYADFRIGLETRRRLRAAMERFRPDVLHIPSPATPG